MFGLSDPAPIEFPEQKRESLLNFLQGDNDKETRLKVDSAFSKATLYNIEGVFVLDWENGLTEEYTCKNNIWVRIGINNNLYKMKIEQIKKDNQKDAPFYQGMTKEETIESICKDVYASPKGVIKIDVYRFGHVVVFVSKWKHGYQLELIRNEESNKWQVIGKATPYYKELIQLESPAKKKEQEGEPIDTTPDESKKYHYEKGIQQLRERLFKFTRTLIKDEYKDELKDVLTNTPLTPVCISSDGKTLKMDCGNWGGLVFFNNGGLFRLIALDEPFEPYIKEDLLQYVTIGDPTQGTGVLDIHKKQYKYCSPVLTPTCEAAKEEQEEKEDDNPEKFGKIGDTVSLPNDDSLTPKERQDFVEHQEQKYLMEKEAEKQKDLYLKRLAAAECHPNQLTAQDLIQAAKNELVNRNHNAYRSCSSLTKKSIMNVGFAECIKFLEETVGKDPYKN